MRIYHLYRHKSILNGQDPMRKILNEKVIRQNHAKFIKKSGKCGSNEGQIVKYTMKLLSCLYQGPDKWTSGWKGDFRF